MRGSAVAPVYGRRPFVLNDFGAPRSAGQAPSAATARGHVARSSVRRQWHCSSLQPRRQR